MSQDHDARFPEPDPDDRWGRLRNSVDRVVEEGHRAAERVVDTIADLGDVARLRLERMRIERARSKKCGELGSRVYALATRVGPDGRPPLAFDDAEVTALLEEIGSLDADLRKTSAELTEGDPGEPDGADA